jgi:hypothetical protein
VGMGVVGKGMGVGVGVGGAVFNRILWDWKMFHSCCRSSWPLRR